MEEPALSPLHEEEILTTLITALRDIFVAHGLIDPQQVRQAHAAQLLDYDPPPVWDCLTLRERTVARLLIKGQANGVIAAKLQIHPQTVRTHIRNIMRKLGVNNRGAAIVLLLQSLVSAELPIHEKHVGE
ncbi:MAG: LuxR C-terminal-related transcriptional regulator [Chloroflexales bacterium]|nr:LuxR C-terminal-related transcriptional regulator [Chloroflexales bacterium]